MEKRRRFVGGKKRKRERKISSADIVFFVLFFVGLFVVETETHTKTSHERGHICLR